MRMLLAAALLGALTTTAHAGPWLYEEFEIENSILFGAYQFVDGTENYALGYQCEPSWGLDAIYVQTPEPYEATTSYAPSVPTQFIVDGGAPISMDGVFHNQDGYLMVFYDSIDVPAEMEAVYRAMTKAQSSIRVIFFNRDLTFSAEGIRAAMGSVVENCYDG